MKLCTSFKTKLRYNHDYVQLQKALFYSSVICNSAELKKKTCKSKAKWDSIFVAKTKDYFFYKNCENINFRRKKNKQEKVENFCSR